MAALPIGWTSYVTMNNGAGYQVTLSPDGRSWRLDEGHFPPEIYAVSTDGENDVITEMIETDVIEAIRSVDYATGADFISGKYLSEERINMAIVSEVLPEVAMEVQELAMVADIEVFGWTPPWIAEKGFEVALKTISSAAGGLLGVATDIVFDTLLGLLQKGGKVTMYWDLRKVGQFSIESAKDLWAGMSVSARSHIRYRVGNFDFQVYNTFK